MSHERMQQAEAALKAQLDELLERAKTADAAEAEVPKVQENFTDPDGRIMKRVGGGFDASYNAQTAVDDATHIIVAAELTNNAADAGQLVPMLRAVRANTGKDAEIDAKKAA